jgi:hypothetical protein
MTQVRQQECTQVFTLVEEFYSTRYQSIFTVPEPECLLFLNYVGNSFSLPAYVLISFFYASKLHVLRVGQNRIYTIYDRIYGDFPANNTVIHRIYRVLANPTHIQESCKDG